MALLRQKVDGGQMRRIWGCTVEDSKHGQLFKEDGSLGEDSKAVVTPEEAGG